MIESLKKLEEERKKIYQEQQKYQKITIGIVIPAVLFIVLGIAFNTSGAGTLFFIIGTGLIFASIIVNSIGYSKAKPFKQQFKVSVIESLLKEKYEQVNYDPNASLTLEEVLSTNLVRRPDRWTGEDYVSGVFNKVSFSSSELKMEQRHTRVDSKGRTYTYYETYFYGRFIVFRFDEIFSEQVRILEKSFLGFSLSPKGFKKVETESIAFNKKFLVESTSDQHAFYIVTPKMIESIDKLESSFGGSISMLWRKNELIVAINDSKNTLEPKINISLDNEGIKHYKKDIDVMANIITLFNLDKSKFLNEEE